MLRRALPLARWSVISMHLLQRIYGTMITAARSPAEAVTVVERAEATLGENDRCVFCDVMFAVPAAIAHADAGDVEAAGRLRREGRGLRGRVGGHRLGRRRRRGARPPGPGPG